MAEAGYYLTPTIHRETVVFACEDDLWTVPAAGGVARRLTSNPGRTSTPALSPDGGLLAFTGRDEGNDEVYVMPAEGGEATRLTYLGANTQVTGWTPDGASIVFASEAGQPFGRSHPGSQRDRRQVSPTAVAAKLSAGTLRTSPAGSVTGAALRANCG
ncbi:MAG: hypothetical protein ACR2GU_04805 [Rubrobacteraceae bacterium]